MLGDRAGTFDANVLEVSAQSQTGMEELVTEIARHERWLSTDGELERRRLRRAETRLRACIADVAVAAVMGYDTGEALRRAALALASGTRDVLELARELLGASLSNEPPPKPERSTTI
jgi:putative protein kinase ArgK-like GTPase of G3E family